ncbi:hypothetical protein [Pseudomonas sp. M47T1]|uniref:hypothetical protein n=1 Tax=Pseudomonas sp. M47T1 TaxID=1179778 RepID=UPI0005BA42F5|nr:hypothetical protein [Pseudomonas sp. M47T1]
MNGTTKQGIACLLLMGCCQSLTVQAAGDGTIVIQRDVQPRVAYRPTMRPDPNPLTVNTNPSSMVNAAVNTELSDGDIAGISSGNSITRLIMPDGNLRGLSTTTGSALPSIAAGHSSGSGSGISNTVNSALSQGLAPLQMMTGGK